MPLQPIFRSQLRFFDRKVIKRNWKKINFGPIQKAGFLVMKTARQSIRRGAKGGRPSTPPAPPKSRLPGKTPPFKMIFSVPSRHDVSAVVGMVGFPTGRGQSVPGLHEHGGFTRRPKFMGFDQNGRPIFKKVIVRIPKRPFMNPALEKRKTQIPQLWRNTITKNF